MCTSPRNSSFHPFALPSSSLHINTYTIVCKLAYVSRIRQINDLSDPIRQRLLTLYVECVLIDIECVLIDRECVPIDLVLLLLPPLPPPLQRLIYVHICMGE